MDYLEFIGNDKVQSNRHDDVGRNELRILDVNVSLRFQQRLVNRST